MESVRIVLKKNTIVIGIRDDNTMDTTRYAMNDESSSVRFSVQQRRV